MSLAFRVCLLSSFLPVGLTGDTFQIGTVIVLGIVIDVIDFFTFTALHLATCSSSMLVLYFVLLSVCFEVLFSSCILLLVVTFGGHKATSELTLDLLLA